MNGNGNGIESPSNFFDLEVKHLFKSLELLDITFSTIAFILGIKEFTFWLYITYQNPLPPSHRKKLEKLVERLSPN